MRLNILGSSSQGNCYYLESVSGDILLLEAGIKVKDIQRALGSRFGNIRGCLITHRHRDHSKALPDLLRLGIDCYALQDVLDSFNLTKTYFNFHTLSECDTRMFAAKIGSYTIWTMPGVHDCPCVSYSISHPELGVMGFITDSAYCKDEQPTPCRYLMIEANYDNKTIDWRIAGNETDAAMAKRVCDTHMSFETAVDYVKRTIANADHQLKGVILIHLSKTNAYPQGYVQKMQEETGIPTYCADHGVCFPL